jgi:hypothetical protein
LRDFKPVRLNEKMTKWHYLVPYRHGDHILGDSQFCAEADHSFQMVFDWIDTAFHKAALKGFRQLPCLRLWLIEEPIDLITFCLRVLQYTCWCYFSVMRPDRKVFWWTWLGCIPVSGWHSSYRVTLRLYSDRIPCTARVFHYKNFRLGA